MDRTSALTLVGKIEATWFNKLPSAQLDAWIEALLELDEGAAGTAFARLRSRTDKVTIAGFMLEARSVRTTDGGTARRPPCGECGDMGWVEAAPFESPDWNANGRPTSYSQMQPCVCREGRAREASPAWQSRTQAA